MFTDNDELSGLLATMMQAEALIILSNIDGIYDGDPNLPESKVITEIEPKRNLSKFIQTGKSSFGRGGMLTKCNIARKVAEEGITVMIANGKREGILLDLIDKNNQITHTTFIANQKKASGVKKWIAHSESFAKGYVVLNEGATEALSSKASSVLLVGITEIGGEFAKGDIVKILNQEKEELGVGIAQYESQKARECMGKKGVKPFIHYDYLYLD
jgi:glutamate 5-kinase